MNLTGRKTFLSPIKLMLVGLCLLIGSKSEAGSNVYWVYFNDKGLSGQSELLSALDRAETSLTKKAHIRRQKLNRPRLIELSDLPVASRYIEGLREIDGVTIRHASRWLNAVSVGATLEARERIEGLPFVTRITPVGLRRIHPEPVIEDPPDDPILPGRDPNFDYGNSLRQNAFLSLPEFHERGYLGEGVLIGVCDAGFDNLDHVCFENIQIEEAWDFVNDDGNVADEDDLGDGQHGTRTLSILAGLDEGHLIGASPRATYILAKTENTEWERPAEEDAWVAAVEWMDQLGVEVISSSLGYSDWYEYEDFDGETAVTTIAANRAVEVGIVVVNSIGNSGFNDYPADKMGAPADGFGVFSIGATNRDSTLAGFSSHGPTFDGRIKPDFVTFGTTAIIASSIDDEGYAGGAGTSFSSPSIAGLCALLLQTNPELTPETLGSLLRSVSHNRDNPDTLLGWGIPNGWQAFLDARQERTQLLIPLHRGWNTISINLQGLAALQFEDYFTPLVERNHLNMVKDGRGRFYIPEQGFNNIPFWNLVEGYQVSVSDEEELVFDGFPARFTSPVELHQGWQIVAFLPNVEMPTEPAMQSLTDIGALDIIKDEWGRFFYPVRQFSNLPSLVPGRGYHLKLTRDATLRYPRRIAGGVGDRAPFETIHYKLPIAQEFGMSILLLAGPGVNISDEAAFRNEKGEILGAGVFTQNGCGIAYWGEREGEPLTQLTVWSAASHKEEVAEIRLLEGDLNYRLDGMAVFEVSITPAMHSLAILPYPTPFNNRLSYTIDGLVSGQIEIGLYDLTGRLVKRTYLEGNAKFGTIDGKNLQTGVYWVSLSNGGRSVAKRVVCIK